MYDVRIYRNMGDSNAFGRNRVAVAGSGVQRAHVQCAREEKCIRNVLSLDKGFWKSVSQPENTWFSFQLGAEYE